MSYIPNKRYNKRLLSVPGVSTQILRPSSRSCLWPCSTEAGSPIVPSTEKIFFEIGDPLIPES